MKKEKLSLTAFLAIVVILSILIGLSSCRKNKYQGYRINNLTGCNLEITTPEKSYNIETTKSIFFVSSEKDYNNLTFRCENEALKLLVHSLGTSPQVTLNVSSYKYNFEVIVKGGTGTVDVTINGQQFMNEPIPFYYGTDNVPDDIKVISRPKSTGVTYTSIYTHGTCVELIKHGNN
jgi:hypothetical protein